MSCRRKGQGLFVLEANDLLSIKLYDGTLHSCDNQIDKLCLHMINAWQVRRFPVATHTVQWIQDALKQLHESFLIARDERSDCWRALRYFWKTEKRACACCSTCKKWMQKDEFYYVFEGKWEETIARKDTAFNWKSLLL